MVSLSVKYRPKDWNEVCAQQTIVKILERQVETETFQHAYLFSGSSGCGKTTVARILANKINKGFGSPDEIDAASHNTASDVRDIIVNATERALDSKYKIFIIDECHSITTQGWQAFLKCIEEPPPYTIFIFCTTEIQKVPDTIKNRCQQYTFNKIPSDKIKERLTYICQKEGFTNYESGVEYITKLAEGGMRSAISYLEKCASNSTEITVANVLQSLDHYHYELFLRLIDLIFEQDEKGVLKAIEYFYNEGKDLKSFVNNFLDFIIDVAKYSLFGDCNLTNIPNIFESKVVAICAYTDASKKLSYYMDKLLALKNMLKNDNSPKTTIEIMFLQMCRGV